MSLKTILDDTKNLKKGIVVGLIGYITYFGYVKLPEETLKRVTSTMAKGYDTARQYLQEITTSNHSLYRR